MLLGNFALSLWWLRVSAQVFFASLGECCSIYYIWYGTIWAEAISNHSETAPSPQNRTRGCLAIYPSYGEVRLAYVQENISDIRSVVEVVEL